MSSRRLSNSLWLVAIDRCLYICLCVCVSAGLTNTGRVLVIAAALVAMCLWGFAIWWLVVAVSCIADTVRQGIPFNLGWWGSGKLLGLSSHGSVVGTFTFALAARTSPRVRTCSSSPVLPVVYTYMHACVLSQGGVACIMLQKQHACVIATPVPAPRLLSLSLIYIVYTNVNV